MSTYDDDIRKKMEELPIEEIEKIWRARDYNEYTQEAFDAIHDILADRGLIKVRETKPEPALGKPPVQSINMKGRRPTEINQNTKIVVIISAIAIIIAFFIPWGSYSIFGPEITISGLNIIKLITSGAVSDLAELSAKLAMVIIVIGIEVLLPILGAILVLITILRVGSNTSQIKAVKRSLRVNALFPIVVWLCTLIYIVIKVGDVEIVADILGNFSGIGVWITLLGMIAIFSSSFSIIGKRRLSTVKICPKCAEEVKRAAKVCRFCGHEFDDILEIEEEEYEEETHTSPKTFAIIAFIIAIVSFIIAVFTGGMFLIACLIGLVLSIIALTKFKRFEEKEGRGFAIAGIVLSAIGLVLIPSLVALSLSGLRVVSSEKAKISEARMVVKQIWQANQCFFEEYGYYPPESYDIFGTGYVPQGMVIDKPSGKPRFQYDILINGAARARSNPSIDKSLEGLSPIIISREGVISGGFKDS